MRISLIFLIPVALMTGSCYSQRSRISTADTAHFMMTGVVYGGKIQKGMERRTAIIKINEGPPFMPDSTARYNVSVKKGDVILIKCLGYREKTIKIKKAQDTLNVRLVEIPSVEYVPIFR